MNEVAINEMNGVNLDQLHGTINAIKDNGDIAFFKFRSKTEWINGGHSRTEIKDFYGAMQEDNTREKPFVLEGDEPGLLLGQDHGANAVEAVLHALASCLTVGIVYNASAMGIKIEKLEFSLEGNIDLHGFLGLSDKVRAGYKDLTVKINLDCGATEEEVAGLMEHVKKTSPVLDIITNPVPVEIVLN